MPKKTLSPTEVGALHSSPTNLWASKLRLLIRMRCDHLGVKVTANTKPWHLSQNGYGPCSCLFVCLFVCLFACLLACLLVCLFACLFVCLFVFVVFFDTRRGTSTWSRHGTHYSTHWQLALAEEPVAVAFVTLPSLTSEECRRLHQYGAFRVLPFAEQECALSYPLVRCAPPHAVFSNTLSALLPSMRTSQRFLSVETLAAPLPRGAGPLFV